MTLYHGSNQIVTVIDFTKSKPNKDFGKGFYLSADKKQALEMAEYKTFTNGGKPILNVYEFDEKQLDNPNLKVKRFEGYTKEWAEFVFANRNSADGESTHDYDIVIGPIANDRVGLQIRRYIEQEITFETFLERLKYMKGITFQYFFGTPQSIQLLKRLWTKQSIW